MDHGGAGDHFDVEIVGKEPQSAAARRPMRKGGSERRGLIAQAGGEIADFDAGADDSAPGFELDPGLNAYAEFYADHYRGSKI